MSKNITFGTSEYGETDRRKSDTITPKECIYVYTNHKKYFIVPERNRHRYNVMSIFCIYVYTHITTHTCVLDSIERAISLHTDLRRSCLYLYLLCDAGTE